MGDPLAGWNLGPPDEVLEEAPPPVFERFEGDEIPDIFTQHSRAEPVQMKRHHVGQVQQPSPGSYSGNLEARVAKLEQQVGRLLQLAATGF